MVIKIQQNSFKEEKSIPSNMGIVKISKVRYQWGDLDLISAGLILLGFYIVTRGYPIGWVIAILGVLKQFSGK